MATSSRNAPVYVVSTTGSVNTERVATWLRQAEHEVHVLDSLEAAVGLSAPAGAALLVLIASAPTARESQALVDLSERGLAVLCALSPAVDVAHHNYLVSIGVHEVIPLAIEPASALSQLVRSGVHRDRLRRQVQHDRQQALIKRDVAAALAVASTRAEIIEALLQGVVALGALGASLWERSERGGRMAMQMSPEGGCAAVTEVPIGDRHPALCEVGDGSAWLTGEEAARAFPDWDAPAALGGLGILPVLREGVAQEVLLIRFDSLPGDAGRHRFEQLVTQLGDTLRRSELQTALETERDVLLRLLSVVSHDLRNPLSTISMASSLLADHEDPDVVQIVARVSRAERTASHLVADLLTFASAATRGIALNFADDDLDALCANVVRDANLRATKGRSIRYIAEAQQPRFGYDAVRIEQVLGNLLSNALTYATPATEITVRLSDDAHALYLDVENRGRSFSNEELAEIFAPMKRLSAVGERGSLGLGLYIVDRIVSAHEGTIWVEPGEPDGVRFCIQLPRSVHASGVVPLVQESERPSASPAATEQDAELSRLLQAFRAPALREVLQYWASVRRREPMPHPLVIERSRLLAYLPDMAFASVQRNQGGEVVFAWESMGPRLERRLRGSVVGQELSPDQQQSQYEAYLRCYESARPAYDYFKQRGRDGYVFERLLLPMTRCRGGRPTDIMAVVVFTPLAAKSKD